MPKKIRDVEDSEEIIATCEIHGTGVFIKEPNWWFCKMCASTSITRMGTANLVLPDIE